jgi:hypothetical protein
MVLIHALTVVKFLFAARRARLAAAAEVARPSACVSWPPFWVRSNRLAQPWTVSRGWCSTVIRRGQSASTSSPQYCGGSASQSARKTVRLLWWTDAQFRLPCLGLLQSTHGISALTSPKVTRPAGIAAHANGRPPSLVQNEAGAARNADHDWGSAILASGINPTHAWCLIGCDICAWRWPERQGVESD